MQKKIGIFLFSLLWMALPVNVSGQEKETGDEVFMAVESRPEFPGGQMEMLKYIAAHVEYPNEAANQGVTGRVMLQFVVNRDGSISNIKVLRSVNPLLDSAAVKVIRNMPLWTPGNQRNKPVPVQMVVPVNFSLVTEPPDKDSVYTNTQNMPYFPGGKLALETYLDTGLKYPLEALQNLKEGYVIIEYIIDKSGKIRSAEIVEGFDPQCNKEAKRLVMEMPAWSQAKVRGFPVEIRQTILIPFEMKGDYLLDGTKYSEENYLQVHTDSLELTLLPEFPGGKDAMMKFISANIVYPSGAVQKNIQGKVLVEFIIDEHGEIQQARVINFCYYELADAALKVVNSMPKWTPGKHNDLSVKVRYVVPIRFALN